MKLLFQDLWDDSDDSYLNRKVIVLDIALGFIIIIIIIIIFIIYYLLIIGPKQLPFSCSLVSIEISQCSTISA